LGHGRLYWLTCAWLSWGLCRVTRTALGSRRFGGPGCGVAGLHRCASRARGDLRCHRACAARASPGRAITHAQSRAAWTLAAALGCPMAEARGREIRSWPTRRHIRTINRDGMAAAYGCKAPPPRRDVSRCSRATRGCGRLPRLVDSALTTELSTALGDSPQRLAHLLWIARSSGRPRG
jgi:hypothetical protein